MEITDHEVMELSLEKVIETKLVQANVTETLLATLKEKYGGMTLKALDDKESYLELKAAAKDCAKVRTLAVKLCTEGREDAVKAQKLWIAKQKEVVGKVAEVEDALDAEIKKFDDEVARKAAEEKKRQEEAYINRQATLTKMGATYQAGSFVLGEASFEAELVKGMDDAIWNDSVVPKFQMEYEKIEAVKVAEEKERTDREAAFKAEQERMRQEQEVFRAEQAEFQRKKQEAYDEEQVRIALDENARIAAEQVIFKGLLARLKGWSYNGFTVSNHGSIFGSKEDLFKLSDDEFDALVAENDAFLQKKEQEAEEKRQAEIEAARQEAIKKEQERQAETARLAEVARQQEEARKAEEMAQAKDKDKWDHFIKQVHAIEVHDMRSGQYRRKMQIAKEKLDEILSL